MKRPTKKQIQFLRIALGMSGIAVNNASCELILTVQKEMKRLKGEFSLSDGTRIECLVEGYYKPKEANK